MRRTIVLGTSTLFIILSLTTGCKDDVGDGDPNDIVFPATNVSYGKHVEPLFFRTCVYSGCHNAETHAGDVSLETYQDALTGRVGIIIPRDTANSTLLWTLEGKFGKALMPMDRPPWNANQIQGMKQWVFEGAQNN